MELPFVLWVGTPKLLQFILKRTWKSEPKFHRNLADSCCQNHTCQSQGITNVSRIHPLKTMNKILWQFIQYVSKYLWTKVVERCCHTLSHAPSIAKNKAVWHGSVDERVGSVFSGTPGAVEPSRSLWFDLPRFWNININISEIFSSTRVQWKWMEFCLWCLKHWKRYILKIQQQCAFLEPAPVT